MSESVRTSRWPLNGKTGEWMRRTPPYLLAAVLSWAGNTMLDMRDEIRSLRFEVALIEARLDAANIGRGVQLERSEVLKR